MFCCSRCSSVDGVMIIETQVHWCYYSKHSWHQWPTSPIAEGGLTKSCFYIGWANNWHTVTGSRPRKTGKKLWENIKLCKRRRVSRRREEQEHDRHNFTCTEQYQTGMYQRGHFTQTVISHSVHKVTPNGGSKRPPRRVQMQLLVWKFKSTGVHAAWNLLKCKFHLIQDGWERSFCFLFHLHACQ